MRDRKYAVGIDFGSESGRAVLVDVTTGQELATAVHPYANGVIDEKLPGTDIRLPPDWALQDPNDYLEVLKNAVPEVIQKSGIDPDDVIGIGADFTACTLLPARNDGTPLCFLPKWRSQPHAWVKLWKHHAAQPQASKLNAIVAQRASQPGFNFLSRYGGKISSEWFFPKVWQILDEAPEVYEAADRFIEAADWIIWQLTGVETRSNTAAGYKAFWSRREGFPPKAFFKALAPRMENIIEEKMTTRIRNIGQKAGELTPEAAKWLGLKPGVAVAIGNVDAHVAVPASTVTEPGRMVIIMGTSNCHMVLGKEEHIVPGMCGYVDEGILPGFFGYEAGQSCVGDHFAWFVENCVPAAYSAEAKDRGIELHALLEQKAARLKPGESGLIALDWWNGNRSVLVDVDLTGLLIGQTLATRPEEIYRALIEATAYGTRVIVKTFQNNGVPVNEIVATGGLPDRNKLLMQIYADVTGCEVKVAASSQTPALGSAMFGAVAAGKAKGGYDSIFEASHKMAHLRADRYSPIPEHKATYDRLFKEYVLLHDMFGRGGNDVMKRLKALKAEIFQGG